ncbi:MAG TPA: DUF2381 family protein [Archangium sp.]|nr:DUF2381 family protein [Archangium sp.]HYO56549.1 DUF2381 family protein [Archangium sp.]
MAVARDREPVSRNIYLSDDPRDEVRPVYVAGEMATVLRFQQPCDAAGTKMLGWEGRFEPVECVGKRVLVEPLKDLEPGDRFLLLVTLADGKELPFTVTAREGRFDHQVNVFPDLETAKALRARLADAHSRERILEKENERFRKEEASTDHALAALLANGGRKQTSFVRAQKYVLSDGDAEMVIEVFAGKNKAAVLFHVKNLSPYRPWKVKEVLLSTTRPGEDLGVVWREQAKPFALKADRDEIPSGQSGNLAVVVDKSAFTTEKGLEQLTLELFRHDGQLNAVLILDPVLVRN